MKGDEAVKEERLTPFESTMGVFGDEFNANLDDEGNLKISYKKDTDAPWQIPYFTVSSVLPELQRQDSGLFREVMKYMTDSFATSPDDKSFVAKLNELQGGSYGEEKLFCQTLMFLEQNGFADDTHNIPRLNLSEDQLRNALAYDLRRHKGNSVLGYLGITAKDAASVPVSYLEDVVDLMRIGDLDQQESYHRLHKHAQTAVEAEKNTLERRAQSAILTAEKKLGVGNHYLLDTASRTSRTTSKY
ncbi:hypothetical protein ACFLZB_02190 [Nanoarchaeota archaeon]